MKEIIKSYIPSCICLIGWSFFLFLQHLACFDVFETNAGQLYVLAALFAGAHYTFVYVLSKLFGKKGVLQLLGFIYAFLSLAKILQLLSMCNYQPYNPGLIITCLALDFIGIFVVRRQISKIRFLNA